MNVINQLKIIFFIVLCFFYSSKTIKAQTNPALIWDSIKLQTMPIVEPAFSTAYGTPFKQPLSDYGWEDGLQISPNGLNLYALYSPSDLFSSFTFISTHTTLPFCSLFGNMAYVRNYAQTYGMDLVTNSFGCDSFANIDILYSHRNTLQDSFSSWQLSGIARAGAIEGSPATLFSETDENKLDLFMFTGNSDIWEIKNTNKNPAGINSAIRLPTSINPTTNEFNADNAFLERINSDSIILVYEKYIDPSARTFMISISNDTGTTWSNPQAITTINNSLGHIEHPCLYKDDTNQWWLYYSLDNSFIVRAKQTIANDWNSWSAPEKIISKGNSLGIGEPTVTRNGDISFALVYQNTVLNDSSDMFDLDPWFLPKNATANISEKNTTVGLNISPNPFSSQTIISTTKTIQNATLFIYTICGQMIKKINNINGQSIVFNREELLAGMYFINIIENNKIVAREKIIVIN